MTRVNMFVYNSLQEVLEDGFVLFSLVVTLLCVILIQKWYKIRNLPAGPWGVPVLGYLPFVKGDLYACLTNLSKKYGDIFSIKLGRRTVIILNSYDTIHEVLVKQGDMFSGVPQDFNLFSYLSMGNGLITSEGEAAKEQRKFILTTFRDFGLGKGKFEKVMQDEMESLLYVLRESEGKPFDCSDEGVFSRIAANVISSLTLGKRFDYEDDQLIHIQSILSDFAGKISRVMAIELFPIIRFLPKSWTGVNEVLKAEKAIYDFFDRIVEEHEETFDPKDIRDMIDIYLATVEDMKANPQNYTNDTTYTREHLRNNILLLFGSGMSTVAISMAWALKLLAINPEWQKAIQEDIDKVVGRSRLPTWSDKDKLPLIEAVMLESHRIASVSPLSVIRSNYEATTLCDYKLPARSNVIVNFWRVHHDPKLFPDPEVFDPKRFIGSDGKINKMRDYVLAFSIGKRNCPGEAVAKQEIFHFLTAILQNFNIRAPEGETLTLDAVTTLERKLKSCVLCAVPRD